MGRLLRVRRNYFRHRTTHRFELNFILVFLSALVRLSGGRIDVVLLEPCRPEMESFRSYCAIEMACAGRVPVVIYYNGRKWDDAGSCFRADFKKVDLPSGLSVATHDLPP